MRTQRFLPLAFIAGVALAANATKIDKAVDTLGPYRLGTPYEELKSLAGFKLDEKRTKPTEDLVAGKIIDRRILEIPTIQRLIFKHGKLYRISVIFGPTEWTEERVKTWVMGQGWGDPGPKAVVKDGANYVWEFQKNIAMILPADGGRWMASIMVND